MKNKCYELVDIYDYLQEPEKFKEIGEHIKNCKECQEKEKDIKILKKIIKAYKFPPPPEDIKEKIKKRIEEEKKKKEEKLRYYNRIYILTGSIAALFLITGGVLLYNKYKTEKSIITREIKIGIKQKEIIRIFTYPEEMKKRVEEIKDEVKKAKGGIIKIEETERGCEITLKIEAGLYEEFKESLKKKFAKEIEHEDYKGRMVINLILEEN